MEFLLDVFERAVPEAVPRCVGSTATHWRRSWRPGMARRLVAQVERFTAGVLDRVVLPRGHAAGVRILGPGISRSTFRYHRTEIRVGEDVAPRGGRTGAVVENDHVLRTVIREAAPCRDSGRRCFAR